MGDEAWNITNYWVAPWSRHSVNSSLTRYENAIKLT